MKASRWVIGAIIVTLVVSASASAQSRRRDRGPGPAAQPGRLGAPGLPGAIQAGPQSLKPRRLKDAELNEIERRRYDSQIAALEKQAAAPARPNQQPNLVQAVMADFRIGQVQLKYGQETKALEAFTKAWTDLPDLLKDAKTATQASSQVRGHLVELQKMIGKDPELVLAFMTELAPQHEAAYKAIEEPKFRPQLAMPLATTWAQLMQAGPLDRGSLAIGANWLLMYPQMVTADRPMTPDQRSEYERRLTQAEIDFTTQVRQMAERQRAQARGLRGPMPIAPNQEIQEADPALQETMNGLQAKRGPIVAFMKADLQFQFGQFRAGVAASQAGWRELLDFYRGNGGGISPVDTQLHFDSLDRIVAANPIQGLVMLDQLDPAYRTMALMDRAFGVKVADTWTKLAADLPLGAAMLGKALFWVEQVSKGNKQAESRYSMGLAELKKKFAEAKKKEGIKDDDDKGGEDGANDRDAKEKGDHPEAPDKATGDENRNERSGAERERDARAKMQPKTTGHGRVNVPRSVDSTGGAGGQ